MKYKWSWTGKEATLEDLQAQVGPGWADIVKDMAEDLERIGWNGEVDQIKEKFGGLRFYFGSGGIPEGWHNIAWAIESYYEGKSLVACELCGKPGERRGSGWLRTLCKECHEAQPS
jgi:hypothetical protein